MRLIFTTIFPILQVRIGHEFAPLIQRAESAPSGPSNAGRMTVDWNRFSDTVEVQGNDLLGLSEAAFEQLGAMRAASSEVCVCSELKAHAVIGHVYGQPCGKAF